MKPTWIRGQTCYKTTRTFPVVIVSMPWEENDLEEWQNVGMRGSDMTVPFPMGARPSFWNKHQASLSSHHISVRFFNLQVPVQSKVFLVFVKSQVVKTSELSRHLCLAVSILLHWLIFTPSLLKFAFFPWQTIILVRCCWSGMKIDLSILLSGDILGLCSI